MDTEKLFLSVIAWVLLFAGLFGLTVGLMKNFTGASPEEYGVMAIGGGMWLMFSALTMYIRNKI